MNNPILWIDALQTSSFFALVALAYFITKTGTGFFNFAIGSYAMVAAIFAAWMQSELGIPGLLAAAISILVVVAVAVVTELAIVRPVQNRERSSELPSLVAVTCLLFILQQVAGLLFGYNRYGGVSLLGGGSFTIGDVQIQHWGVLLVVAMIVIFVAAALWMSRTATGRMLRAVGDNLPAAHHLGFPVNKLRIVSFIAAGLLAAIAGILFSPHAGVTSRSGLEWALGGFLAFVVGGTGRIWAPLAGAVLLGLTQVFVTYYFGGEVFRYVLFVAALVFFAVRPQGLFAKKVRI